MNNIRYILTKYETIRRTEKVEYVVDIPEIVRNKKEYAGELVFDGDYLDCKVVDIVDSEKLDEEVRSLRKIRNQN